MAELDTYYEVEFDTYTNQAGKTSQLIVVIEFEDDEEYGLMANFYVTAEGIDREFFSYSLAKTQDDASDLPDKEWMRHCQDIAKADVASGQIDFKDAINYLERQR